MFYKQVDVQLFIFKDYLEPVTHNIKQNLEYFGETNDVTSRKPSFVSKQTPVIIVSNEKYDKVKNSYYNDDVALLFNLKN